MTALDAAVAWLRGVLPLPAVAVREQASAAGFSWATIRRAQTQLGVRPEKTAGGWLWRLSTLDVEHLAAGDDEHLGDADDMSTLDVVQVEHLDSADLSTLPAGEIEHLAPGDALSTLPASTSSTPTMSTLRAGLRGCPTLRTAARVLTGDALASHLERQMDAEIVRLAGIVDMSTLPPDLARRMDEHLARIEAQAEREAIMSVERGEG